MHATASTALLISPVEQDHSFLRALFNEAGWTLHGAHSFPEAATVLPVVRVVLIEDNLPVGNWKEILELVLRAASPARVIVISLHADDRLWAEALNLGAYDVLAKPFNRTEVVRVLNWAWNWHDGLSRSATA